MKDATIVFDLDGTLVDTAPDLINATNVVMDQLGLPHVEPTIARNWISFGARVMILKALAHANAQSSEAEVDGLLELFLEHYSTNIAAGSRPFPGVVKALESLSEQGARLCVCTNKREALARLLLDKLGLSARFLALTGRDTLATFKPHPGHVLGTIELAGGTASRAIMVGDSATDINAARAANIPSIAVTFGYSSVPARNLQAGAVIEHFDDLEPAIRSLLYMPHLDS